MVLKGRKRNFNVPRTPSGQISRALRHEEGIASPSAIKRLAFAATRGMNDRQWGTVIGQLFLAEKLTPIQFEAGKRWDALARRYHTAMQAPPPDPKAAAYEMAPKVVNPDLDSHAGQREAAEHELVVQTFATAHQRLCSLGMLTEATVRRVCEESRLPDSYEDLLRLRNGLSGLGDLWKLSKVA